VNPNGSKMFSHLPGCHSLSSAFSSPADMSFAACSVVLSSTLSDSNMITVGASIGLSDEIDTELVRRAHADKR
jgi:hypothetical protein